MADIASRNIPPTTLALASPVFSPGDRIILVMGGTGTGKSSLIKTITGRSDVPVGEGMDTTTAVVCVYPHNYSGKKFVLVDTPAFDDIKQSEANVLETLGVWLAATYQQGVVPSGIIYLHSINENSINATMKRGLELFRLICGDEVLANLTFVSTMWDIVPSAEVGAAREKELRETLWATFLDKHATTLRYDGNEASGLALLNHFADRQPIPLRLQREMVNGGLQLPATAAGQVVKNLPDSDPPQSPTKAQRTLWQIIGERILQMFSFRLSS